MSSSKTLSNPILGKRSRTLSERVTENGDPLVIKKKARAAEKASTFYIRKQVLKRLMMKIIIGLRKRFRLMLTVTPATNRKPPKLMNPKKRRVPRRVLKLSLVSVLVHESIYVFFKPTPSIEYINERRVHVFECNAKHCKGKVNGRMVRRYLDTTDAKSTGSHSGANLAAAFAEVLFPPRF